MNVLINSYTEFQKGRWEEGQRWVSGNWLAEAQVTRTSYPWWGLGLFFGETYTSTHQYLADDLSPSHWYRYPEGDEIGVTLHVELNEALREWKMRNEINRILWDEEPAP